MAGSKGTKKSRKGKDKPSPNALTLLECVEQLGWFGKVRFNQLSETIEVQCNPPWPQPPACLGDPIPTTGWRFLTDHDLGEAMIALQQDGLHWVRLGGLFEVLTVLAGRSSYHPVRIYLDQVQARWDGVARLHRLFTHYFIARLPREPERRRQRVAYLEAIATCFGVGAVARVREPGCTLRNTVALVSGQNLGKSTGVRELAPIEELYTADVPDDLADRDAKMAFSGKWIVEFDEARQLGTDVAKTKAFLSRRVDRLRLPYARLTIDKKRQGIAVITCNKLKLTDSTGNERYWPVALIGVDIDAIIRDRDMLWAEAQILFDTGQPWWLPRESEFAQLATEQQAAFTIEPDQIVEEIRSWVALHDGFTMEEVFSGPLGMSKPDVLRQPTLRNRVAEALRDHLDCEHRKCNQRGPLRDHRLWYHVDEDT
jgi:predicted P-loop ATPase